MDERSKRNLIRGLKNIGPAILCILILLFLATGCQTHKEEEAYRPECHGAVSLSDFIRLDCHQKRYASND